MLKDSGVLAQYWQNKALKINRELENIFSPSKRPEEVLYQAMNHSLLAGGKRLRPALHLATAEALGKDSKKYISFACALEMIHTYSLIHDDLPAMDNDDWRRGKPTCHKAYGEANAILAGDALLTHAFVLMLTSASNGFAPQLVLEATKKVAWAAGLQGMIVGQVLDVNAENKNLNITEMQYIHKHKTGALFAASVLSAAILAEANEAQMAALQEYCYNLGLAFQITDDILDVVGDEAKLGKPIGSDDRNHKATYPALVGIEKSRQLAAAAAAAAAQALNPFGQDGAMLAELPEYLLSREI